MAAAAPTPAVPGIELTGAQRLVLTGIKRRGEATADELAEALEISASAVRQHLAVLRGAGLVSSRRQRSGPGRPVEHYRATVAAESLYATADGDLSIEILAYVEDEDPDLVGRIFERRRRSLAEAAAERAEGALDAIPLVDRIEIATELLDARGYLADSERLDDGGFRINLRNCAIWSLATRFDAACTSELELMQSLIPDADIERITHKVDGSHTCAYELRIGPAA